MMKNKKFYLTILAVIFALGMALAGCSGGGKTTTRHLQENYTIECGETFYLPLYEGAKYSVTDSKGETVPLIDSSFVALDNGGYTLTLSIKKTKETAKIAVTDKTTPILQSSFSKKFVEEKTEVAFPTIWSEETDATLSYESLKFGETAVEFKDNKFTPSQLGDYVLTAKALDKNGNATTKEITFTATKAYSNKLIKIADFSTASGLNHISGLYGLKASYSEDYSYIGDEGSVKLKMTADDKLTDQQFRLTNLLISDIENYYSFNFYVYNDSEEYRTITINFGFDKVLAPKVWTEVIINFSQFENISSNSHNPIIKEFFKMNNINGLSVTLVNGSWTASARGDFYFSSIYGEPSPYIEPEDLNKHFKDFSAVTTRDDEADAKRLIRFYKELSVEEQASVTEYSPFFEKYMNYLYVKNGVTKVADQIIYSNTGMGIEQMTAVSGSLSYDTKIKYGTDSGSTKLKTTQELWNSNYKLLTPTIKDVTKYSGIYLYAYTETAGLDMRIGGSESGNKTLVVGEWTRIELTDFADLNQAVATDLTGAEITVHRTDWNKPAEGTEIFISGIYGFIFDFVGEVKDLIATLPESAGDTTLAQKELIESIQTKYTALKASEKPLVTNYYHFEDCYVQYLFLKNSVTKVADQVIYSNTAMGVEQMSAVAGTLSYDTTIKYGTDSGSTKIVAAPLFNFNYKLAFPAIKDITKYSGMYLYAYTTTAGLSMRIGENGAIPLVVGSWNRIEITDFTDLRNAVATNITGAEITVHRTDWGNVGGSEVYISGIYAYTFDFVGEINGLIAKLPVNANDTKLTDKALIENIQTKYTALKDSEKPQVAKYGHFVACKAQYLLLKNNVTKVADQIIYSNTAMGVEQMSAVAGALSYDTTIKHGTDAGSTKLIAGAGAWNSNYKLEFPAIQDITKYSGMYLYAYTETAGLSMRIGNNGAIPLVVGSWTRIEITNFADLNKATAANLIGAEITVHRTDWEFVVGSEVYISGIYGYK